MNQPTDKLQQTMRLLEDGVKAVFDSGKYKDFLSVMSKFHTYSINNQILILMQMPAATHVAGYNAWKMDFNRIVRKGSKGIRIIAPMTFKKTDADGNEHIQTRFRVTHCFDVSQTEGDPLPELTSELTGSDESFRRLIPVLQSAAPCPVLFTDDLPNGVYGCYSLMDSVIKIRADIAPQHACKTLIHEIAHSLLDADRTDKTDRQTKECRAESIAFVVCSHFRIDTSDYSFPYIAAWSSGRDVKELKAELSTIRDTAASLIAEIEAIHNKEIHNDAERHAHDAREILKDHDRAALRRSHPGSADTVQAGPRRGQICPHAAGRT